jgi:hypothetical protein
MSKDFLRRQQRSKGLLVAPRCAKRLLLWIRRRDYHEKRGAEAPQVKRTEAMFIYIEGGGGKKVVLTGKKISV